MRFQEGQLVAGRYRIVRPIGSGGGAEIYKVLDIQRSSYLALKLLRSELCQSPNFLNRFKDEADALANLSHPNIVRFYEFVRLENLFFIVMDFVDGVNLRQHLKQHPSALAIREVTNVIAPVCSALYYAHQKGIIHCDIKPENILIDSTGKVLLSDFGIASFSGMREVVPGGIGTPSYMAPEQITNEKVRPQTDIYALGVMLYELFTGVKPFIGEKANPRLSLADRIKWEHLNLQPTLPSQISSGLPAGTDHIILKCLEKDPDYRFADVRELSHTLQIISNSESNIATNLEAGHKNETGKKSIERTLTKNQKALIPIGLTVVAVVILLIFLLGNVHGRDLQPPGQGNANLPQTFTYPTACMEIILSSSPRITMYECIKSITILSDQTMQVNVEWRVTSQSTQAGITVQPDTDNHNMYIVDDLGNRMDHIGTGGGADQEIELYNGDTKTGWFIFPSPNPDASSFYFIDGDNNVKSPGLDRVW